MSEENKSMSSISSGLTIDVSQTDSFSKMDEVIFSFFYPLYEQPKHPSVAWEGVCWFICLLQMVTISFFRIDLPSQRVNFLSFFIGYPDGTSLGFLAGQYLPFVVYGCCGYFALQMVFLEVVQLMFGRIASSQPWIISVLRWVNNFTLDVLLIPLMTNCITSFDCFERGGVQLYRATEKPFFKDGFAVSGFAVGVVTICLLLGHAFLIRSMIFNHNPKHGGLWSSPSGTWQSLDSCLMVGCVFAMRMLYAWPFWRGVVTVGTSLGMVVYFVWKQPIYKLKGNVLRASTWCIFGCMRLLGEIGYAIEGAVGLWIVPLILQLFALVVGIVLSAVVLPQVGREVRERRYLLTNTGNPLIDTRLENAASSLPPMNKPERIEPSLRFLQVDSYRSLDHLSFADFVYTQGLKTNKNNSELCFYYASFLQAYRKNYMKSQSLLKKARMSSPGIFLRFVLFCKSKEGSRSEGGANDGGMNELNSLTFTTLMSKAISHYELALEAMKDFFETATSMHPDYRVLPNLLNEIVKNEYISRKSYEELIASHGQNTTVLRNYARLLLDIYHDEDAAEMILNRADQIEETTSTSMGPTVTAGVDPSGDSMGMNDGFEMDAGKNSGNGSSGDNNEGSTTNIRSEKDSAVSSRVDGDGDEKESAVPDGGASEILSSRGMGGDGLDRSFGGQKGLGGADSRSHKTIDTSAKRNKRKRKKKKKKKVLLTELSTSGTTSGEDNVSQTLITCLVVSLNFFSITVLIISLVVYLVVSSNYQKNLDTLRQVCDLSYITARTSVMTYYYTVHDFVHHFRYVAPADGWGASLVPVDELKRRLSKNSERMTSMLSDVYDMTSNLEPWETSDIETYTFIFKLKNETQPDGSVIEVIDEKKQMHSPSSMLEVLAALSQTSRQLAESTMTERPTFPDYLPNIQYILFNTLVPILDGAKRAIMSYWNIMNQDCDNIIIAFVLILCLTIVPVTTTIGITYMRYTRVLKNERHEAYHVMLDVPKMKMQNVIRRLLNNENGDGDDTTLISLTTQNQMGGKQFTEDTTDGEGRWTDGGSGEEGSESNTRDEPSEKHKMMIIEESVRELPGVSAAKAELYSSFPPFAPMESNQQDKEMQQNSQNSGEPMIHMNDNAPSIYQQENNLLYPTGLDPAMSPQMSFNLPLPDASTGMATTPSSLAEPPTGAKQPVAMRAGNITGRSEKSGADMNVGQQQQSTDAAGRLSPQPRMHSPVANKAVNSLMFNEQTGSTQNPMQHLNSQTYSGTVQTLTSVPTNFTLDSSLGGHMHSGTGVWSSQGSTVGYEQGSILSPAGMLSPSMRYSVSPRPVYQNVVSPIAQPILPQYLGTAQHQPTEEMQSINNDSPHTQAKPEIHLDQRSVPYLKPQVAYDDDEDAERDKQIGLVRNAIEDTQWEEALEKDVEALDAAYKQFPSPIPTRMYFDTFLSVSLGVVAVIVPIVIVVVCVIGYKPISANIILSGMRSSILFQIMYMTMAMIQPTAVLKTDQSITFPRSLNPVLHDSSHCSADPEVYRRLMLDLSRYFETVHMDCHFGDSIYTVSNDSTYDDIVVKRMEKELNRESLLKKTKCILEEGEDCSGVDPKRMYGIVGDIYGFSSLLSRLRVGVERIQKMDITSINALTAEPRFILSAMREDLNNAVVKMTNSVLEAGKQEVEQSKTIMIIVIAVMCVIYLVSLFLNSMSWLNQVAFIRHVSAKLIELLPIDENEKEIEMMQSMITGYKPFDNGRDSILDAAQQLLTSIKHHEHLDIVSTLFKQLATTLVTVFTEEEKEMEKRGYAGLEKHKQEHILLRQRLTLIGDQLRSSNKPAIAIGKRRLIALFDTHFTDEDLIFAETIPESEKNHIKSADLEDISGGAMYYK
ncbi:uncharacterized protein MONOS_5757 [Monocercomonoides exilis]|uniref:uncharacterized protein n=1 Tax=Monocercomonoides exilis TaxID=2049356 RepID=UPI003559ED02|nr:hypothetical protein MONOS_5757 [Monocercomonoides exilis]|eukprot:MONOS_5757.1-p1 / transcript=MONOS_5757.1 / gene=MONOS_5757 / organism=Monocercomonoides_exilis_PA203 / gene_product=unspecified product / transcript_product=unspecified product / location=Mono_scaffold00172:55424-61082(+) / protein_length=1862 / sequence_SO=supercontig / SO=protein_coding / is_pseudo=false